MKIIKLKIKEEVKASDTFSPPAGGLNNGKMF